MKGSLRQMSLLILVAMVLMACTGPTGVVSRVQQGRKVHRGNRDRLGLREILVSRACPGFKAVRETPVRSWHRRQHTHRGPQQLTIASERPVTVIMWTP